MRKYDVVIVGAGPAGGQCARELAQQGHHVLLLDKAKSFLENNYSSGGAPLDILTTYALPESIVGTFWNALRIRSTHSHAMWTSPSPLGPIIDFEKLRAFLSEETCRLGGELRLACLYQSHQHVSGGVEVVLKDLVSSETFTVQASVLVDATGSERKVLASQNYHKQQAIAATGIEYHIKVQPDVYQQFANSLNFYLGHEWMPQGYAWIFPMSSGLLKAGVIRYFQNKQYVPHDPSYQRYLQKILDICGPCEIHDKHGKTILYTEKQKDCRFKGPLIAIGDAISSVNPLGWEGIRHAMASGRLASCAIHRCLTGKAKDFSAYDRSMTGYFGMKWRVSEKLMKYLLTTQEDVRIDQAVDCFSQMNNEQIMQVIFDYRFRHTLKSFFCYFVKRLKI